MNFYGLMQPLGAQCFGVKVRDGTAQGKVKLNCEKFTIILTPIFFVVKNFFPDNSRVLFSMPLLLDFSGVAPTLVEFY